jgi:NADPH:quinone reductase-like Zn-dependent oxidoreductase
MTQKMKAVRVHGPDDARLETIDIPQIGKEEILIRVKKVS